MGWWEISTHRGSPFNSRTFLDMAKEVCLTKTHVEPNYSYSCLMQVFYLVKWKLEPVLCRGLITDFKFSHQSPTHTKNYRPGDNSTLRSAQLLVNTARRHSISISIRNLSAIYMNHISVTYISHISAILQSYISHISVIYH